MEIDITVGLQSVQTAHRRDCSAPWRPPIEFFETDDALAIRAELGGLTRTDIEVVVSSDELVIRGERSIAKLSASRKCHESRVRYGPFEALVRLPFPVAVDAAGAEDAGGFLTVTLPRRRAARVTSRENGQIVEALRGDQ